MQLLLMALLACGPAGDGKKGGVQDLDPCEAACPDGTRIASYSDLEIVTNDAFYVVEDTCESICERVTPPMTSTSELENALRKAAPFWTPNCS